MWMACKTRNTTVKKVMLQGQPTRSRIESIRLARDYAALSTPLECAGSEHVRGPVHVGVVALYGPTLKIRSYSQTHTLSLQMPFLWCTRERSWTLGSELRVGDGET